MREGEGRGRRGREGAEGEGEGRGRRREGEEGEGREERGLMARVQGKTTHTVYIVVKNSVYNDNFWQLPLPCFHSQPYSHFQFTHT